MCCLKRKVSTPKRPKDSKTRCLLSFSFETLFHNGKTLQNMKNSIKAKELSKSKTLRVFNKLDID